MALAKSSVLFLIAILASSAAIVHGDQEKDKQATVVVRSHNLYPPYIDVALNDRFWDFGGSTVVNVNRYIRLTPDFTGRKGWLWSREPLEAESFSIEFEYKIHGRGVSIFGDGFGFWFTTSKGTQGSVMGNSDKWNGLAILFDTYDNAGSGYTYPYVAALMNDGTKPYNKDKDGKEMQIGGCQADIRDRPWSTIARVKYIKNEYLSLELNPTGAQEWTECFRIPYVKLPELGYVGFTAETGGLSDNHDIISVTTHKILKPDAKITGEKPNTTFSKDFMEDEFSGPSWLLVFITVSFIAGVAWYGFKFVNRTERNKRF